MNIGQTFETQLWLVAKAMWMKFAVPLFSDFGTDELSKLMVEAWYPADGKLNLYDGRSWVKYDNRVTVWYMHIIKLVHMVEDKIHARSVWPYSLITQQPLGGKARQWWQRFGEMEVWALQAYSAVHTLQEMLTVKSDDVQWRNKTYEAIIKWWKIKVSGIPESFNLVTFLFKWLGQNIIPLWEEEMEKIHTVRIDKIMKLGLKWITSQETADELEVWGAWVSHQTEEEEKKAMMDTVVAELTEHGDINE